MTRFGMFGRLVRRAEFRGIMLRDLYEMDIQVHEVNGQRICTYYR